RTRAAKKSAGVLWVSTICILVPARSRATGVGVVVLSAVYPQTGRCRHGRRHSPRPVLTITLPFNCAHCQIIDFVLRRPYSANQLHFWETNEGGARRNAPERRDDRSRPHTLGLAPMRAPSDGDRAGASRRQARSHDAMEVDPCSDVSCMTGW
ncbi:MAG TPA: hypothetical protein VM450_04870, partial [Thermomicrobiales bacterium]|nr:hypothetical protein [Thermomicrobiales bacterium]